MIAAVVIAMIVMFLFSPKISAFIHKHPTLKMLALSFLVMIGLSLIIEGWDHEAARKTASEKLYLFRHGIFLYCGNAEYGNAQPGSKEKDNVVELNEPVLEDKEN